MDYKIFLGGTCNNSTWRDSFVRMLNQNIKYFNPVVKDWTSEHQIIENNEKENKCNIHLYVITCDMIGSFSIAEAVQSSLTKGKITIFHVIPDGFIPSQLKSFQSIVDLIQSNGGIAYIDNELARTARIINNIC